MADDALDKCLVCLDVAIPPAIMRPCGHVGCGPCLEQWKERSARYNNVNICPNCKVPILEYVIPIDARTRALAVADDEQRAIDAAFMAKYTAKQLSALSVEQMKDVLAQKIAAAEAKEAARDREMVIAAASHKKADVRLAMIAAREATYARISNADIRRMALELYQYTIRHTCSADDAYDALKFSDVTVDELMDVFQVQQARVCGEKISVMWARVVIAPRDTYGTIVLATNVHVESILIRHVDGVAPAEFIIASIMPHTSLHGVFLSAPLMNGSTTTTLYHIDEQVAQRVMDAPLSLRQQALLLRKSGNFIIVPMNSAIGHLIKSKVPTRALNCIFNSTQGDVFAIEPERLAVLVEEAEKLASAVIIPMTPMAELRVSVAAPVVQQLTLVVEVRILKTT